MKISFCKKILWAITTVTTLTTLTTVTRVLGQHSPPPTDYHGVTDIDNAWIKVKWTEGTHYYHNTLTREDRDFLPDHLQQCTEDLIKQTCN